MNRPRRAERGFSLVELMVAVVIFSIVGGIVVVAIVGASRANRAITVRHDDETHVVDVATRLGGDVNAATRVLTADPDELSVLTQIDAHCHRLTWTTSAAGVNRLDDTLDAPDCMGPVDAMAITSSKTRLVAPRTSLALAYIDQAAHAAAGPGAVRLVTFTVSSGDRALPGSGLVQP